jgi:hypothetical protein
MPQRKPVPSLEGLAMAAVPRLVRRVGEAAVTLIAAASLSGGQVAVRRVQHEVEAVVDRLAELLYTATPAAMHADITDRKDFT